MEQAESNGSNRSGGGAVCQGRIQRRVRAGDCARGRDITEGSVYNHFISKAAIMDEILGRHAAELERAMPKSRDRIGAYGRSGWKPAGAKRAERMEASPEKFDRSIVLILMNGQYRLPKARQIVMKCYIGGPRGWPAIC